MDDEANMEADLNNNEIPSYRDVEISPFLKLRIIVSEQYARAEVSIEFVL